MASKLSSGGMAPREATQAPAKCLATLPAYTGEYSREGRRAHGTDATH